MCAHVFRHNIWLFLFVPRNKYRTIMNVGPILLCTTVQLFDTLPCVWCEVKPDYAWTSAGPQDVCVSLLHFKPRFNWNSCAKIIFNEFTQFLSLLFSCWDYCTSVLMRWVVIFKFGVELQRQFWNVFICMEQYVYYPNGFSQLRQPPSSCGYVCWRVNFWCNHKWGIMSQPAYQLMWIVYGLIGSNGDDGVIIGVYTRFRCFFLCALVLSEGYE